MKKNQFLKKRNGSIDSIMITIILIFIVLLSIPLFKVFTNNNYNNSKKSIKNTENIINESSNFLNNNIDGTTQNPYK